MIKKLLNTIKAKLSHDYSRDKIEAYLSKSTDLNDLENRIQELDKKGAYNRFYI